jgi:UDP-glucose 4-epimerase
VEVHQRVGWLICEAPEPPIIAEAGIVEEVPLNWLLTGGAGYIGCHVIRALQASGRGVVVVDDLSTGIRDRVPDDAVFVEGSVLDQDLLESTMREHDIVGVVHLAAKKAVGESVEKPLWYYRENVGGMESLLAAMVSTDVKCLVYSSSAAVYGEAESSPVMEDDSLTPISPYGETKVIGEWLTRDVAAAHGLSWTALRYFNVAGSGSPDLGDPSVANLIPIVLRAVRNGTPPSVYGDDYPTPDGTCLRDYIHVADLAEAHAAAAALVEAQQVGTAINIGTGKGSSVLDVISSIGRALGRDVSYEVAPRRAGDPPSLVASADRAHSELGWRARYSLDDMTSSAAAAAGFETVVDRP